MTAGRRPSRLPAALRHRTNALLALSVALLVAAALGVQLGQSAIGEINPIHFQGAAEPPRAIDPNAVRPSQPDSFATAYGWSEGEAARYAECGPDCDRRAFQQAAAVTLDRLEPAPRAGGPYWRETNVVPEPAPWAPGETGPRRLSVERYLHYPVEEDVEAEGADGPAAKAPDGEGDPADDE